MIAIEDALAFIQVVEAEGFSSAAEKFNVSKSVLSRRVNQLEQHLNTQLLSRTTRKVSLTEQGQAFYSEVSPIAKMVDRGIRTVESFSDRPQGSLRILAPHSTAAGLRDFIVAFATEYPEIQLDFEFMSRPMVEISNHYDFIISGQHCTETMPNYNAVAKKIFTFPLKLLASTNYLDQHGTPSHPDELCHHTCLSSPEIPWTFHDEHKHPFTVNIDSHFHSNSHGTIHKMLCAGIGISYVFQALYEKEMRQGLVKSVLNNYTKFISFSSYLFYPPANFQPQKNKVFKEALLKFFDAQ